MKIHERWRVFLYVRTFTVNLQVSTVAGNSHTKRITKHNVLHSLTTIADEIAVPCTWNEKDFVCSMQDLDSQLSSSICNINKTHAETENGTLVSQVPNIQERRRGAGGCLPLGALPRHWWHGKLGSTHRVFGLPLVHRWMISFLGEIGTLLELGFGFLIC